MIKRYKSLFYEITYSEYDLGYYCEVFNKDGKTLYESTHIYVLHENAVKDAKKAIDKIERKG